MQLEQRDASGPVLVQLAFRSDDAAWGEQRELTYAELDAGILEFTCFILPVHLSIGGVELLDCPYMNPPIAGWTPLPILGVARGMPDSIDAAWREGSSKWEGTELPLWLSFVRVDDDIEVISPCRHRRARAPYTLLHTACAGFAAHVRDVLTHEFPELLHHDQLAAWFAGDDGA